MRCDPAELEQFEPERLDLGQYAVQRGLVGNGASKQGVLALGLGAERGEGALRGRAEVAANAELVAGHRVTAVPAGATVLATLARANRHRAASMIESASTAAKSPTKPEATPTPTTGMISPQ